MGAEGWKGELSVGDESVCSGGWDEELLRKKGRQNGRWTVAAAPSVFMSIVQTTDVRLPLVVLGGPCCLGACEFALSRGRMYVRTIQKEAGAALAGAKLTGHLKSLSLITSARLIRHLVMQVRWRGGGGLAPSSRLHHGRTYAHRPTSKSLLAFQARQKERARAQAGDKIHKRICGLSQPDSQ